MEKIILVFIIGLFTALIAGLFVFLLSYNEYSHHFFSKKKVLKFSFESALMAFIFFVILSCIVGLVLVLIIDKNIK